MKDIFDSAREFEEAYNNVQIVLGSNPEASLKMLGELFNEYGGRVRTLDVVEAYENGRSLGEVSEEDALVWHFAFKMFIGTGGDPKQITAQEERV